MIRKMLVLVLVILLSVIVVGAVSAQGTTNAHDPGGGGARCATWGNGGWFWRWNAHIQGWIIQLHHNFDSCNDAFKYPAPPPPDAACRTHPNC